MKKGQGEVITTVLIILLVLGAIVILWNVVYSTIKKSSEQVNVNVFSNTFEIKESKIYPDGSVKINVRKISGSDNVTSMKFIFYNKEGSSFSITKDYAPDELETKQYDFTPEEIISPIDRISIIPFFGSTPGFEIKEPDSIVARDSDGNRILEPMDGLVSWWKFNEDIKDSIGNNHGTCTSCPEFTEDKNGNGNNAIQFNGINNSIAIPDSETISFDKTQDYAISTWINVKGYGSLVNTIIEKWTGSSTAYPYIMRLDPRLSSSNYQKIACGIYGGSNGDPSTGYSTTKFTIDSGWHFVLCNFENSNGKLSIWVDGNLENSNIYDPSSLDGRDIKNNNNLYLGSRDTNYFFNGIMDNVMIFNRSLNDEEIKGIYESQN